MDRRHAVDRRYSGRHWRSYHPLRRFYRSQKIQPIHSFTKSLTESCFTESCFTQSCFTQSLAHRPNFSQLTLKPFHKWARTAHSTATGRQIKTQRQPPSGIGKKQEQDLRIWTTETGFFYRFCRLQRIIFVNKPGFYAPLRLGLPKKRSFLSQGLQLSVFT